MQARQPPSHLSKIAPKHSKNGCLSIMPMLCQTRPLATLSAQTEPSRYRSDQARPRPRQDPPLDLLTCPTTAVILASVVKIDDCMAVCQLLAGILGLIGLLRTAASTPLDEATERRAAISTVTSVMMPCRPAPPRLLRSAGSTGAGCQALTGHAATRCSWRASGGGTAGGARAHLVHAAALSEERVSVEGLHDLATRSLCASQLGGSLQVEPPV